jgi:hypothetical protein
VANAVATVPDRAPLTELDARTRGWQLGKSYAYTMTSTTRIAFGHDSVADFDLDARVEIVPLRIEGNEAELYLSLSDARITSHIADTQAKFEQIRTELSAPYFVTLSGGRVLEARFQKNVHPVVAGVQRMLSAALQSSRPLEERARWSAHEYDGTGQYVAEYQETPAPNTWQRRKSRYLAVLSDKPKDDSTAFEPVPEVVASSGELTLGAEGRPVRVAMHDELLIKGAQTPVHSVNKLSLEAQSERKADRTISSLSALRAQTFRLRASDPYTTAPDPDQMDRARIGDLTFDSIVRRMEQLGSSEPPADHDQQQVAERESGQLLIALAALFRREPTSVALAVAKIQAGSAAQELADALASSGTEAAQLGLIQIMTSKNSDPALRRDLIVSLSRTRRPSRASIRALSDLVDDETLGTQALFGLGSFSRLLRDEGDSEEAGRIGRLLLGQLAAAKSEQRVTECLRAIANSGHAGALPGIKPFLKDQREQVRADALQAMSHMNVAEVDVLLAARLEQDPSARVLLSAIDVAKRRSPTPALVAALRKPSEATDTHVRYRATELMVRWLRAGANLRADLQRVADSDNEPRVRDLARSAL